MIGLVKKRKYRGVETYLIEATAAIGNLYLPDDLPAFLVEPVTQAITAEIDPRSKGAATVFKLDVKVKGETVSSLKIWEGIL